MRIACFAEIVYTSKLLLYILDAVNMSCLIHSSASPVGSA